MEGGIRGRGDLISIFNSAHFMLRHYAKGYYPVFHPDLTAMSVNRMFFPLKNPNGPANFIEDSFRRYPLKPGKMYFIPAYLPARVQLDRELFFLSVQVSLEIFPGVELFSDCPRMLEIPAPPESASLLKIFDSSDPQTQYLDAVRAGSLAYSMLLRMLDRYDPEDFWKPLALRKYADLTDYLNRDGNALTSVSDLAAEKKLSRENFTRHFIADTGITPKQLIDRFVTGRCLNLIQQGCSFKEIALRMKFRDVFAFSRYFRRNMGETPRDWRSRWNSGALAPRTFVRTGPAASG